VGFTAEAGVKGGRPRLSRPTEVAQRLIESNELALQRPYWRALGYDVKLGTDGPYLVELEDGGAKLRGTSRDGRVTLSPHEDLEAMQRAAERLQDRVYGRPRQGHRVETKVSREEDMLDRQIEELIEELVRNSRSNPRAVRRNGR
jgi:hypothetical protein